MNEVVAYDEKLKFLNKLIIISIKSIAFYSDFVGKNLLDNWQNYLNKENSNKKRNLLWDKINKSISKLSNKVYGDIGNLNALLNEIDKIIYSMQEDKLYNKNDIKELREKIDSCVTERDLLILWLNQYKNIEMKENKILNNENKVIKKSKELETIPVIKRTYCDKNGYWYANISVKNGNIIIDNKRFEKEIYLYEKCLEEGKLVFVDYVINKKKISPYEKRRRNYIKSMFILESDMLNLKEKKVDMIYPLEKLYNCAEEIVNNLYRELFDYKKENDIFDALNKMTVKAYGSERKLQVYKEIFDYFNNSLKNNDVYVNDELYNYANTLKNGKDYKCFNEVEGTIPTIDDLYHLLSKKIIRNIDINYELYIYDIKNMIEETNKYMNIDDLVEFYHRFKEILLKKTMSNANIIAKNFVLLQKTICELISQRSHLNVKFIPQKFLEDEVIF